MEVLSSWTQSKLSISSLSLSLSLPCHQLITSLIIFSAWRLSPTTQPPPMTVISPRAAMAMLTSFMARPIQSLSCLSRLKSTSHQQPKLLSSVFMFGYLLLLSMMLWTGADWGGDTRKQGADVGTTAINWTPESKSSQSSCHGYHHSPSVLIIS